MKNWILFYVLCVAAAKGTFAQSWFPTELPQLMGCPFGEFVKKIEWDTTNNLKKGIKFHCYKPEDRPGSRENVTTLYTHFVLNPLFQGSAERTCAVLRGVTVISDKNSNDIGLDITSDCRAGPSIGRNFNCGHNEAVTYLNGKVDYQTGTMKNLIIHCRDVGDITTRCQPEDILQPILTCDATQALAPLRCVYEKKMGVSRSTSMSESQTNEFNFYTELGFELGYSLFGLSTNFKTNIGFSDTTSYNWQTAQSTTWSEETTVTLEVDVPPGVRTVIYEVLGKCSFMLVRPNEYRRVDSVNGSSIVTNEIIPENDTVHQSNATALVASKLAILTVFISMFLAKFY